MHQQITEAWQHLCCHGNRPRTMVSTPLRLPASSWPLINQSIKVHFLYLGPIREVNRHSLGIHYTLSTKCSRQLTMEQQKKLFSGVKLHMLDHIHFSAKTASNDLSCLHSTVSSVVGWLSLSPQDRKHRLTDCSTCMAHATSAFSWCADRSPYAAYCISWLSPHWNNLWSHDEH